MTSDNVLKFLGNREYLHQVSYQELKSMVVQYPYSLSLRYLLAMKSQQEDNTDVGRNIELLSTYGVDRAHLHKIFSENPITLEDLEDSVIMGEDFLELKELSSLEREIEETQFIKQENNLNFLEGTQPTNESNLSVSSESDDTSPTALIDSTEELEDIITEVSSNEIIEEESIETKEETTLILESTSDDIADSEEEFVEMDFEDSTEIEEDIGIPKHLPEIAPSESFSTQVQDNEFDENGLPADAIEVGDLFKEKVENNKPTLEELFEESEQEAIAEEAVSDSVVFIENPEEVLEEESQSTLILEDTQAVEENLDLVENKTNKPIIPFEVSYSDIDPYAIEETSEEQTTNLQTPTLSETTNYQILPSPIIEEDGVEKIIEEKDPHPTVQTEKIIAPEEKKKVPQKATAFKFDSLDRFEVALQENKLTPSTKPLPKTNFSSWQEKYSGVSTFSSIHLNPIGSNGGKVIKQKKKIGKKKYEKTVAFAEESLKMDTHIVSETLAQLLVKQGQYSQARTMYKELSLTIPEKSSFFAAEIEKIQNLPDEDS